MLFTLKVNTIITDFIVKKLPYDLSSHAGLALIGQYRKSTKLKSLLDSALSIRAGIANSDVLKSNIALLSLRKNDFDAIENFRDRDFFKRALDLTNVPSSPTLRQRLDSFASQWFDLIPQINHRLLSQRTAGKPIDFGVLDCGCLVCQLAVLAMNLLRLIGQNTLTDLDSPVRRSAKRSRTRTVMDEMMFKAAGTIKHAGRWILGLGQSDSDFAVLERHCARLKTA